MCRIMPRLILVVALLVSTAAAAFSPSLPFSPQRLGWVMAAVEDDPVMLHAGGGKGGMPDVQEAPLLFDDGLLTDMQLALLAMEKRIQEGPYSLSKVQVDELEQRLNRIMKEMRENEHKRPTKPTRTDNSSQTQAVTSQPATVQSASSAQPQRTTNNNNNNTKNLAPTTHAETIIDDTSIMDEEGPIYDGRGGMGQPRGTVNTYVIEGMDEMTTDEYRLALQQSIIDKQNERRKSGAALGGRGTSDYFNSLGSQGGMFRNKD